MDDEVTFTVDQLAQMIPNNPDVNEWYDALSELLPKYEIDTAQRIAAFIAQCSHESNEFRAIKENLNYRWESLRRVFPKYFPTDELAQQYAHNQEAIANKVYGNRMGNGDEESGDGFRYCGRGLIQLTGKNNYQAFADSIGMSLEECVEYLGTFKGAVESACWFWNKNNLNHWADAGDVTKTTKVINGGTLGLEDRIAKYNHALGVMEA